MRVLVLGGSSFVGRAIAEEAVSRGHDVSLFNRGRTDPVGVPGTEQLIGDRDADLGALRGRSWDATVDVSAYLARQVESGLDALGDGAGHYTLISSISVYRDGIDSPYAEDAPVREPAFLPELDRSRYGECKVGCEVAARRLAGDGLLVLRPGYVVGPRDYSHRFTYWVERVHAGGPILGPVADQPSQCVDARDLARLAVDLLQSRTVDTVHVTGPTPEHTFADLLREIADGVGQASLDVRWSMASADLPLSSPPDDWPIERTDCSRARGHGLTLRPIADSARDTLTWVRAERAAGTYRARAAGLDRAEERRLIAEIGDGREQR